MQLSLALKMATADLPAPVELIFVKHEPSTGVDPKKLPLIFGHGLFSNKARWGNIPIQVAEQTKRTVYIVDLRDHGESPRTKEFNFNG